MGFFKDFKQDLSQAVNELTDDAVKIASDNKVTEETDSLMPDDVMVDTLNEGDEDAAEDIDVEAMLRTIDSTDDSDGDLNALDEKTASDNDEDLYEEEPEEIKPETKPAKSVRNKKQEKPKEILTVPAEKEDEPETVEEAENDEDLINETTIISRGLKIKGDIESSGSIELLGEVEGNVICRGRLKVNGTINGNSNSSDFFSDKAEIKGDINCEGIAKIGSGTVIIGNLRAKSAVIAGAIKGEIDVHGPVIIDSSAIVMGDIKSESFQINGGAVLEGYISQCYSDNSPKNFFKDR